MKKFLLFAALSFSCISLFAQGVTYGVTPHAQFSQTSGGQTVAAGANITATTNGNVVTINGQSGGATNGIAQSGGSGTNTTITNITLNGTIAGNAITPFANGGTGTNTQGGAIINVNGTTNQDNSSYFADATHNIINQPTGSAAYPGQLLLTYDSGTGSPLNGPIFTGGSDKSWRGSFQFAGNAAFYSIYGGTAEGVIMKTTNSDGGVGQDNVLTLQNQNSNHFSALRWLSMNNGEAGAMGYGNMNAPFYALNNYLEDNSGGAGFYFAASGHLDGGLEKTTHNFVWYDGTSGTNDTTANVVARITSAGSLSLKTGASFPSGNSGITNATTWQDVTNIINALTLPSSTFAQLSGTNVYTGTNTFSGPVITTTITNTGNVGIGGTLTALSFIGNGSGLTNLLSGSFSFTNAIATSAVTNFTILFGTTCIKNAVSAGKNVCFASISGPPGDCEWMIFGTNGVLVPTNCFFAVTNWTSIQGTNYYWQGTNSTLVTFNSFATTVGNTDMTNIACTVTPR